MILSENFRFWVIKFSIYLNRRVFVIPANDTKRKSKQAKIDSTQATDQRKKQNKKKKKKKKKNNKKKKKNKKKKTTSSLFPN